MNGHQLVAAGSAEPRLEPVERPAPGRGELRIRAAYSLVSPGTELHYLDRAARTGERFPLGYCSSGTVHDAGAHAPGFAPGQPVIAMGWGEAVHGDVVVVPYRQCVPVPPGLPLPSAVVANLGATAVHAVDRAGLTPHDEVAVVGAGAVGLLVAQTAAAAGGGPVTVLDRRDERLDAAAALGLAAAAELPATRAETGGRVVFLCVTGAADDTLAAAARWAAAAPGRPRLIAVGRFTATVRFSVELGNVDIRYAARCGAGYRDPQYARGLREVDPPPGEGTVTQNLTRALDLVSAGAVAPAAMALPVVRVEDAPAAYAELRRRPRHAAVLIDHREG
ncbi:oxidoreductase [Dactylosporangium vinaceum]|uniref:Zinc-binding alcohol dehydrogenase n=1 Tax=Dactylosporangium vinaceum TaxID=53362 RepID=A0ABV5MSA4_9ACTN|nr:hypothetical protein [Dactylosporangium vinaceum]UAC00198.1 oxidoreductase [Dactylosporangium vinaceum]